MEQVAQEQVEQTSPAIWDPVRTNQEFEKTTLADLALLKMILEATNLEMLVLNQFRLFGWSVLLLQSRSPAENIQAIVKSYNDQNTRAVLFLMQWQNLLLEFRGAWMIAVNTLTTDTNTLMVTPGTSLPSTKAQHQLVLATAPVQWAYC